MFNRMILRCIDITIVYPKDELETESVIIS